MKMSLGRRTEGWDTPQKQSPYWKPYYAEVISLAPEMSLVKIQCKGKFPLATDFITRSPGISEHKSEEPIVKLKELRKRVVVLL